MSQSETSEYILETQKLKGLNPTPLDTIISTTEKSGARQDWQDTSEKQICFGESSKVHRAPKASAPASLSAKNRRQIRAIQKAISQEIQGGSRKGRSRILRGLEEALKKLESDRRSVNKVASLKTQPKSCPKTHLAKLPLSRKSTNQRKPLQTLNQLSSKQVPEKIPGLADLAPSSSATIVTMETKKTPNGRKHDEKREKLLVSEDHDMDQEDPTAEHEPAFFPLTEKCHHYTRRADVDWDIQKYWDQRYSIFSKYDEGIHMTDDAWFGVTPEPVARKVAGDLAAATASTKTVLIDMFAGAGGNVIAFALSDRWLKVIAIEKDPSVIACAQHNAFIYGVFEKITWINDDCFSFLSSNSSSIDPRKTVVFASPPWGGPGYTSDEVFDLNTMSPYSVKQIHDACRAMDSALYLPRTSNLRQIAKLAPEGEKIEAVQYCMHGASKALVAYIPATASVLTA